MGTLRKNCGGAIVAGDAGILQGTFFVPMTRLEVLSGMGMLMLGVVYLEKFPLISHRVALLLF